MVQEERIRYRNDKPEGEGDYVLYWMQQSQRTRYNHALEYAALRSNELRLPLVVLFCLVPSYLFPPAETEVLHSQEKFSLPPSEVVDVGALLKKLPLSGGPAPVDSMKGGTSEAERRLDEFISLKLKFYDTLRNDPVRDFTSHMSPYLHFGQISPLYIALKILRSGFSAAEKYIDELVVRRELSINFLHYNEEYDDYACLPDWAKSTLEAHAGDTRPYLYSPDELEGALSHDACWNAAQGELVKTGSLQGYMRMYWGKKIMEWTPHPREAFATMVYLNNTYALDGRDPNSYAGIAWCLGKHDRPWKERPVFGKVRYMNENGLRRKFDIDRYVERIDGIA